MATPIKSVSIAVSAYDRAASWVISLNILVGATVAMMFLIWLSQTYNFQGDETNVKLVENVAGRGDHAAGLARDVEAPGVEELMEETEPPVDQLLEAMTEVVSTQAATLDTMPAVFSSKPGDGVGDSRPPGPENEGDDIIPRGERWEIKYASNSLEAYTAQLDFFRIELGAIGGGEKQVDYARNLRKGRPDARRGLGGDAEKRLYMLWSSGTLKRFDQQLLRRAGINVTGRITVQFYPPDVEDKLATIEMAHAQRNGRDHVKQIAKTVFGVRRAGNGFEFYVESQRYRAVT